MSETESYDISQPPETMVEQAGDNRVTQWLLITGDRRAVAAAMLVGTFVAFVIFGLYGPRSIQKFLSTGTIGGTLFYALLTGIITTVTLVLTLSQFGLSQQLSSDLGSFRDRMNHSMEFRRDAENHIDVGVSPGQPTEFFQALARAVEKELDDLDGAMADDDNPSGTGEVAEYIDVVRAYSEDERERLETPTFGSFGALLPVLNHNYSWKIYLGRQLRDEHADELSKEAMEQFDELIETLLFFGPTREYFKSLALLKPSEFDTSGVLIIEAEFSTTSSFISAYPLLNQPLGRECIFSTTPQNGELQVVYSTTSPSCVGFLLGSTTVFR
ncbi:hypothetical protein [Halococcus sp. PRR34]|uniref:hypothetical protein n=1 Tax=Halococcus sp. PRR34 TaxID=3020830 RepID=UPI00235E9EB4|nr:hypothetical protein [Halococcus sp. PRR34]